MKCKNILLSIVFIIFTSFLLYSIEGKKAGNLSEIDWVNGRIYSSMVIKVKNDYNFANNSMEQIDNVKEKTRINFYSILKKINVYESFSVIDFVNDNNLNNELTNLIDNSKLYKMEYPDLNTIRITYSISLCGENSLYSMLMFDREDFTNEIKGYIDYNYNTDYTGLIIDARGELSTFEGEVAKVKPALFLSVKDSEGKLVFDRYNIDPNIIKNKGMIKYTTNINENFTDRVGKNPLKITAYGIGDKTGSIIVISEIDAKKILSTAKTRNSIKSGSIIVIVD